MIEFKNIRKTYNTGELSFEALKGVNLKIEKGEYVAIIGPSGSGKSTLLHIMGLLHKPTSGEFILDNKNMSNLDDKALSLVRSNLIGFVFQQFHLLPRMSAYENVALPLMYSNRLDEKENAKLRLEQVGLKHKIFNKPNEVSGGEQQRIAIARALVNNPEIILADEPTGNLDSKNKIEIMNLLEKLHNAGNTLVIITHEKEIAERAHRVITVQDGMIVSDIKNIETAKVENSPDTKILKIQNSEPKFRTSLKKILNHVYQAASILVHNKLRSILSMLGILIGVAAVIAMLALGAGAQESMKDSLASLGSNLVTIRPGRIESKGTALAIGAVSRFTTKDVESLKKLKDITNISATVSGKGQIVFENKNCNTSIQGVFTTYSKMHTVNPTIGRFFDDSEVKSRERVAIVGMTVIKAIFPNTNPIGKTIKINRINFRVIGIAAEKGSSGFRDQDDVIYIPITTAMYRLLGTNYYDTIEVEIKNQEAFSEVEAAISQILYKNHHIPEKTEDAFQIRNMQDIQNTLSQVTKTMTMLLGFISALSLLVGGIGIMNIMLVSVTERTREIGLRKALGATNYDIMIQFLIESIILSLTGGIIGIIFGIGVADTLSIVANWSTKITANSIILASIFSIFVGVFFGLWPAKKASGLDPIEALRYE